MKLVYLQPAQRDLLRFQEFFLNAGVSKTKSDEIILKLVQSLRILVKHPHMGYNIGDRYGFTTPFRAFISGRYIAIYEVVDKQIGIRRIYHQCEDYLKDLLPPDL